MSEWGKIGVTVLCSAIGSAMTAAFLVWNLLQDHETRLQVLDMQLLSVKETVGVHIRWYETQHESIIKKLTEIQVDIGRIQGGRGNGR